MENKHLHIYLNDHYAGSTVGLELAKRAAKSNEGTDLGKFLSRLADELRDERENLRAIMDHVGAPMNPVKAPLAWAAEKAGRLKPNGQITGYSPLSRMIELEGLVIGITGKLGMWRALAANRDDLGEFGLDQLIAQAERQREEVESFRIEASRAAIPG